MGKPAEGKFSGPWTHSKLSEFEACKQQFKFKHIDKLEEFQTSPALERGEKIHKNLEAFYNGWVKEIDPAFKLKLIPELLALKKDNPTCEKLWAHDKRFLPLADPFDKGAYARAKLDAFVETPTLARTIDFKSGKVYPTNEDQVRFYGMLGLKRAKKAKKNQLELWYVDQGQIKVLDPVTSEELPALEKDYSRRAQKLYDAQRFPPEPGYHCARCPFRKGVGGPCQY